VESEFPGEHVTEVFERHGDSPAIETFIESMSHGPAAEINILDPDDVIIGGGVVRMRSFPREGLRQRILGHVRRPLPFEGLRIHFSPGDEYGAFSAALNSPPVC
jgi:allose kinase